jgi:hypothetical protein
MKMSISFISRQFRADRVISRTDRHRFSGEFFWRMAPQIELLHDFSCDTGCGQYQFVQCLIV